MMNDVAKLLDHSNDFIKELANKALGYKSQYELGKITLSEYQSLGKQLLNMEEVGQLADSEDTKQEIANAVQTLQAFLGLASML